MLARHGKPLAQLVPLDSSPRCQLGFLKGSVDEAFFDPLPDDELERWGAAPRSLRSPAGGLAMADDLVLARTDPAFALFEGGVTRR